MTTASIFLAALPFGDSGTLLHERHIDLVTIAKMGFVFAGGYFAHKLLLWRNRKERLQLFLASMTQFKDAVLHSWSHSEFATYHRQTIRNIRHAAAPVLGDLRDQREIEFDQLIHVLCEYADADVQSRKKKMLADIDAITGFFDPRILPSASSSSPGFLRALRGPRQVPNATALLQVSTVLPRNGGCKKLVSPAALILAPASRSEAIVRSLP